MNLTSPHIIPQRGQNGKGGHNGNGHFQVPNAGHELTDNRSAANTLAFVNQLLQGTLPDPIPDLQLFGQYARIVPDLIQAFIQGGPEKARIARDGIVNITPSLAPVLGEPICSALHPWHTQVFTLEDAYKPRPPLEYVVRGLFPLPSLSIVYGAPGTLKSMLLMDMALCVAAGLPWLKPLPGPNSSNTTRATLQTPVLWLDFDNGPRKLHERMEALARARNLPIDALVRYLSMPDPWLDASDETQVKNVSDWVKELKVNLIIIDNLSTVSGEVEENSAAMGTVMSHLRRLAEDTGAAVVVVHHQRKGGNNGGHTGDNLRGHSSINAALDLALKVERKKPGEPIITLESTKTRGEDVWPFSAMFAYEPKPDGELASARFFGVNTEGDASTSDSTIKQAIINAVKTSVSVEGKGTLSSQVKEKLDTAGTNRVRGLIDELVSEGKLTLTKDGSKHTYSLPS